MTTAPFLQLRFPTRRARRHGITLVDAVITIMIMGILTAVAVPKFVDAMLYHRAQATAQRIKADLQWSRSQAISGSTPVTVQFDSATHSYSIPLLQDLDRSDQSYLVQLAQPPYQALIVSADCGGDESLVWDRYGVPDSGATITVQAGTYVQSVTIDAVTGKATIP